MLTNCKGFCQLPHPRVGCCTKHSQRLPCMEALSEEVASFRLDLKNLLKSLGSLKHISGQLLGRKLRTCHVRCRCCAVVGTYPCTHDPAGEEVLEIARESGGKGISEGGGGEGKTKAQFFSRLACE